VSLLEGIEATWREQASKTVRDDGRGIGSDRIDMVSKKKTALVVAQENLQRYATRGLVASTSLATRRMGAISTSEDGTTSLSKMDSPRLPTVWVRRRRLPVEEGAAGDGEGAGEDEDTSAVLRPGAAIPLLRHLTPQLAQRRQEGSS